MKDDKRLIEKEDWQKALGVIVKPGEDNGALAQRDYKVSCNVRYIITTIKGYHIWWCSSHHQPYTNCLEDKAEKDKK